MTLSFSPPPKYPGVQHPIKPEKGFPNWAELIEKAGTDWTTQVSNCEGEKVIIASNTGMHGAVSTFDSVLACALTLAGARVSRVFCDGSMPACLIPTFNDATPPDMLINGELVSRLCKVCFNRGTHTHRPMGLPEFRYLDFLEPAQFVEAQNLAASIPLEDIPTWTLDGIAVGEHAYAGALRYFAKGDLADEPQAEGVIRRYLQGGIVTKWVYEKLLEQEHPDVVVLHHGIYSPQGIAADVCRKAGVRVVTWVVAYRKSCFIFSHDDTYHHTMMTEPVSNWENLELTSEQKDDLNSYLKSRSSGGKDWIYFHKEPDADLKSFAKVKGIDLSKPIVSILTNVMWDAQLHYPANAFAGMKEWIVETVRYFIDRPDLEAVIRIHPAEVRGAIVSRQRVAEILRAEFPDLPRHVHIVEPTEEVSTYSLAAASNAVIIYGTKMGTELTPRGLPVIVGGEAWIRNKGLTQDAETQEGYFNVLGQLPFAEGQYVPDRERAERYAFHFFFRRMLPLPFLQPNGTGAMFGFDFDDLNVMKPGNYPGLDVITRGIMKGAPFTYEAEIHGPSGEG